VKEKELDRNTSAMAIQQQFLSFFGGRDIFRSVVLRRGLGAGVAGDIGVGSRYKRCEAGR